MLALPIFPGRHQPSIVGRNELNYRVRNGNGWTLILISTNYMSSGRTGKQLYYIVFRALCQEGNGDPYRIRTDVKGVRGLCLNHLSNGPCSVSQSRFPVEAAFFFLLSPFPEKNVKNLLTEIAGCVIMLFVRIDSSVG